MSARDEKTQGKTIEIQNAADQAVRVWRLAFGVWRSAFGVRRLAFGVRRLAFRPRTRRRPRPRKRLLAAKIG
jgi:hypothetical protein